MTKNNKKSDDPGRMTQRGSSVAASNPRNSTTSSSAVLSSSSNTNHQSIPSSSTSNPKKEYDPTDEDRLEILLSTKSKGGRFRITKPNKVIMLEDVFVNQNSIIHVIKSVDKEDRTGFQRRLHDILILINTKNKREKSSVNNIAQWLVALFDIFSNVINLRRVPLRNTPGAMKAILDMMKKVDNQIRRDVFNDAKYDKNGRVALTAAQDMKPFDKKLRPDDEDVCCPYCMHKGTLNFIEDGNLIRERNQRRISEFRENKRLWELHQQNRKNPPPTKKDGKAYSSAPIRPKLEKQIVKCCCSKFWCSNGVAMDDGFIRRFCPIDCKKEDGTHYPLSSNGLCSCLLCCCDCSLAHPYGLEAQIRTTEKLLKDGKMDLNSQVKKDKELFNTMKKLMSSSDEIATSYAEDSINEMKNDKQKFQMNESMVGYIDDVYHETKTRNVMSQMQGIDPEKLFGIGKFFGNKTKCPVPGGTIDTRSINMAKNREYNNRLNAMTNGENSGEIGRATTPLMNSKFQPSFNQVTNEFIDANKTFTPAARAVDKVKGSRDKKRQERQTKLATILDEEKKHEKSKKSDDSFSHNFGADDYCHYSNDSNNPMKQMKKTAPTTYKQKVKRAKKRAICLCHLNKANSQLSATEKKQKEQNLPVIKMFNDTISGGEDKCQLLVETASDAQPFSPESVSSEMIHSVALNLSEP